MRAKQWKEVEKAEEVEEEEENDWILLDKTDSEDNYEEEEERKSRRRSGEKGEIDCAGKCNNLQQQASFIRKERPNNLSSTRIIGNKTATKSTSLSDGISSLSIFFFVEANYNDNKCNKNHQRAENEQQRRRQMALEANDIKLIRASWIPARTDPSGSGALLFKGLFTKFPDYLKFFSQFSDLDLERIQENKRLVKHAIKVIDTVTFVVDSIGDETKANQLNDALINLVRGHLKRRIGLQEFRNLGIVLIDFICDLNQRRRSPTTTTTRPQHQLQQNNSSSCEHSLESVISLEAELIHEDNYCSHCQNYNHSHQSSNQHNHDYSHSASAAAIDHSNQTTIGPLNNNDYHHDHHQDQCANALPRQQSITAFDTNLLVRAWTKLYGSILDLVEREGIALSNEHI